MFCCNEIMFLQLHAYFVILDDIIDESETRRGRLCWYRNPDVGLIAINDGILINSGVYQLLRKYFSNHPYYIQVVDLFHEVNWKWFVILKKQLFY